MKGRDKSMSILRIKDKNGKWVDVPSLNVEVNEESIGAAIPTLIKYMGGADSPFIALDGESVPIGRIASGTYVGTGLHGVSYPVMLGFRFVPKIVWVAEITTEYTAGGVSQICMLNGVDSVSYESAVSHHRISVEWDGRLVLYYSTNSTYQFNESGKEYVYYAIG